MENIKCIYVDWSAPRILKGLSVKPKKEWEIAILIRSVYYSKNINGFSPVLYCDKITEKYYQCLGIIDIFDEVFPILPIEEKEYNTSIFWAAGKFEAIKHCDSPFILMDLDLEIRKKIDLSDCEVFCSHEERIDENCCLFYPDPNLIDKRNYFRNIGVEFENRAINTSLLYFKDIELAKEYANISIDYMKTVKTPDENLEINSYILLAEQRFLSEFRRIKGISPKKLISGYYVPSKSVIGQMEPPFEESNVSEVSKYFLHIWGYKILLDSDPFLEMDLYRRLIIDSPDEIKDLIENSVELNYSLVQ